MKFTILVDNKTEDTRCEAEWGLSILVEANGRKLLFDTGSSNMFYRNAKNLGISLEDVEAVLISHGHFDHTEGVPAFLECNNHAPIYLHKDALYETYGETDGELDEWTCGIRWDERFRQEVAERMIFTEGVVDLGQGFTLVGDIPWLKGQSATDRFFRKIRTSKVDGIETFTFVEDSMNHEQFLVVEEEQGIHLISGCSHKGIMAILDYTKKLFPEKKILSLIAGMHLYPVSPQRQDEIIGDLATMGIPKVFPLHCTGMPAIIRMKNRLGDCCIVASSGETYTV